MIPGNSRRGWAVHDGSHPVCSLFLAHWWQQTKWGLLQSNSLGHSCDRSGLYTSSLSDKLAAFLWNCSQLICEPICLGHAEAGLASGKQMPFHLLGALVISIVMQERLVISCHQTLEAELNRAISFSKDLTIHVFYSCFFYRTVERTDSGMKWTFELRKNRSRKMCQSVTACISSQKAWLQDIKQPWHKAEWGIRLIGIHFLMALKQCSSLPLLIVSYQFSNFYEWARTDNCS